MISLIIPTTSKNKNYTDSIIENIRELYPDESKVEVILEISDEANLAQNYNNAVARASGEKIILLHNDMILPSGFIETMDKHIIKGRVTSYTRVEPPIFDDLYPGKVLVDCGRDLETFDKDKFNSLSYQEELIDGGSQLFFGCYKEDYIQLDDTTFSPPAMWCSDDDLHLRYSIGGFEHKVSSAYVYHFVSKTSRANNDYEQAERNSNRNFIRKWGFRKSIHNKRYIKSLVISNCDFAALANLEPWCDKIYIDDGGQYLTNQYITAERDNTVYDLSKRIFDKKFNIPEGDIIIEFDAKLMNQYSFNIIQNISDIITESGEVGKFQVDIFNITINDVKSYEENLIKVSN
jgi:hypothetical protein